MLKLSIRVRKKHEHRAEQAALKRQELLDRQRELETLLRGLEGMSEVERAALLKAYAPRDRTKQRSEVGIRYVSPQGYKVIVGRNARDNQEVTFKLAKSRDIWLHAQGYPGSHVIVQAQNNEVPFETILFAAQLAAAYSKAGQSENVPVDYTLRKNVWKAKGAPPGAVHFSQQKTVYVNPSRRPE